MVFLDYDPAPDYPTINHCSYVKTESTLCSTTYQLRDFRKLFYFKPQVFIYKTGVMIPTVILRVVNEVKLVEVYTAISGIQWMISKHVGCSWIHTYREHKIIEACVLIVRATHSDMLVNINKWLSSVVGGVNL